jgi:hypothetical protein
MAPISAAPSLPIIAFEQTANYVTSPPSETAPDLADFHQRQGHAPYFAGKGREIALVYAGWDDTKVV